MSDKEVRYGIAESAVFTTATTDTSNGAVIAGHDAMTPAGGAVPLVNIFLGEVIFGGVGSGIYGMIFIIVLAVFVAGLMVGRTPEYLGKKIEAREMKLAALGALFPATLILTLTAVSIVTHAGLASIFNPGAHGFTEALYAYTSQASNNGSAFAGYGGTTFSAYLGGIDMLFGRFVPLLAALALGGSLAAKKIVPASAGTFRSDGATFTVLLDRPDRAHRRPHALAGAGARADRRGADASVRRDRRRLDRRGRPHDARLRLRVSGRDDRLRGRPRSRTRPVGA